MPVIPYRAYSVLGAQLARQMPNVSSDVLGGQLNVAGSGAQNSKDSAGAGVAGRSLQVVVKSCRLLQVVVGSCRSLQVVVGRCRYLQVVVNSCMW